MYRPSFRRRLVSNGIRRRPISNSKGFPCQFPLRRMRLLMESLEDRRLLAAVPFDASPPVSSSLELSLGDVRQIAEVAVQHWVDAGASSEQIEVLESLRYAVADLGTTNVGQYRPGGVITLDDNGAGNLWFVDATPMVNEEFSSSSDVLMADSGTLADSKMDLLTVVLHEQAHALGLSDLADTSANLMSAWLEPGLRRLPMDGQADGAIAGSIMTVQYLASGDAGGGQSVNTVSPHLSMNYVIALQGTFPSQNLSGDRYLGSVDLFAANFAPRGYALAQGQTLPISQNTALFSILGTIYGGDGMTTFKLPDLRGRVPIGAGQGPGLSNYTLGQASGGETVTLSAQQLPAHTHTVPTHTNPSGSSGNGSSVDIRQPTLALTPVITVSGVYPSQSLSSDDVLASVSWFAGNFAPRETMLANGAILPIAQYTALFSILGTTYGGDGMTTFGLPDLRGRMAVGQGTGPGLSPVTLGQQGGAESVSLTSANLPSHSHSIQNTSNTLGVTGSGQSFDVRQPFLGLNYSIATVGTFPSQNLNGEETHGDDEPVGEGFISGVEVIDESEAQLLIEALSGEAIRRWQAAGLNDADIETLRSTRIEIGDLPSGSLASADDSTITLDRDASNRGWFIDITPGDDAEFDQVDPWTGELVSTLEALGHYDLLTTLMHEQGHIVGLAHSEERGSLMYGGLRTGSRKLPNASDLELDPISHSDDHDDPHYLEGGSGPHIASVGMFAGNFGPQGWPLTHGQTLSISQTTTLFSLLGTIYGGDGMTTFRLPDTRGRAVVGAGQASGLSSYPIGSTGGANSTVLAVAQLPVHNHDVPVNAPTANDDFDLNGNSALTGVNVLANDTDPDGNPQAPVNSANQFSIDLDLQTAGIQNTFTDANSNVWTLDTSSGIVTMTPASGFSSLAQISYHLTDVTGQSDDALIGLVAGSDAFSLIVDTTADVVDSSDNVMSLREAILLANDIPGADVIQFAPALTGGTITLLLGEMLVSDDVSIQGIRADQLTIDANQLSRIFDIDDGSDNINIDVEITRLTLTGGRTETMQGQNFAVGSGAAIRSYENLTVRESTISGNTTAGVAFGGGIFTGGSGALTVRDSTLSGNTAYSGGALINYSTGPALIDNTTISGNTAFSYAGGGIFNQHDLTITNSTISNNLRVSSLPNGSGGLHTRGNKRVVISNSIIAGNVRDVSGVQFDDDVRDVNSTLTVDHSLFGVVSSNEISDGVDGNQVGVTDPLLGPLSDNGGPTQTHALEMLSPAIDTGAVPLAHQFELNGSLVDSRGGPSLDALGGIQTATGYDFGPNQGLNLVSPTINPGEYTIELTFSFDELIGYQKIIDFQNLATDYGLYTQGDRLVFYTSGQFDSPGGVITAGQVHQVILSRNAATDEVSAFVDGDQVFSFVDTAQRAVFSGTNQVIRLFQDDVVTGEGETVAGFVDQITIDDRVFDSRDQRGVPFLRTSGNAIDIGAFETQSIDFGDAPESYGMNTADGGASHQAIGPQLGANRDDEFDGTASLLADGDDLAGTDDDDGVLFGAIVPNSPAGINLDLQNASAARVDAFIDFNGDGDWDDAGEKILDNIGISGGLQTLNYTVPAGIINGTTFARVRVSTSGGLSPNGSATDGEVEDYAVTIGSVAGVTSAMINGGGSTRSEITSIEVSFESIVDAVASDFVLTHADTGQNVTGIDVNLNHNGPHTTAILTFTSGFGIRGGANADVPATLINGSYELRYRPVVLDGTVSPIPIDDFFRKYGETNAATATVSLTDFAAFRSAFGKSLAADGESFPTDLDADRDGNISLTDFAAFRAAFGT